MSRLNLLTKVDLRESQISHFVIVNLAKCLTYACGYKGSLGKTKQNFISGV